MTLDNSSNLSLIDLFITGLYTSTGSPILINVSNVDVATSLVMMVVTKPLNGMKKNVNHIATPINVLVAYFVDMYVQFRQLSQARLQSKLAENAKLKTLNFNLQN